MAVSETYAQKVAHVTREMEAFDQLPPELRAAVREADDWYSPTMVLQLVLKTPVHVVVGVVQRADNDLRVAHRKKVGTYGLRR